MKAFSHLHTTSLIFLKTLKWNLRTTDDVFFLFGQTGLHWAAKHGNDDLIKLLAGTHKSDVNARTVQCLFSPPYIIIQVLKWKTCWLMRKLMFLLCQFMGGPWNLQNAVSKLSTRRNKTLIFYFFSSRFHLIDLIYRAALRCTLLPCRATQML